METCYILFGSNMGDKKRLFGQACSLINNRCGPIVAISSAYDSEPWGFEAEEWFLNRLVVVETCLSPDALMEQLLGIESELGRVRAPERDGYASRTVDLDILYYGDRVVRTEMASVPHPRLHLRRFALLPLCELVPDMVHPVLQCTQKELLEACPDDSVVVKVEDTEEQFDD